MCGEIRPFVDSTDRKNSRKEHVAPNSYYPADKWNLDDLPKYVPESRVSGTLRMWGSNYIGWSGMGRQWEEEFRRHHPRVKFEYNLKNALLSLPALGLGSADLAPGRQATWAELVLFQRVAGHEPLEVTFATGSFSVPGYTPAFGIFVHKDNPLTKLNMKQLDGIFGAQRSGAYQRTEWHPEAARGAEENIRSWGQLGLGGEWQDRSIQVYGMNLRLTAVRNFELKVFQGGAKWNENLIEYANCMRADGTYSRAESEPMRALSRDRYGITYSGQATDQTKPLAIAPGDTDQYVEYTIENVRSRAYPLYTEMYFFLNREPGKPLDPKVREYMRYILSREGQAALARDGKYLPLTKEMVLEQRRKLD